MGNFLLLLFSVFYATHVGAVINNSEKAKQLIVQGQRKEAYKLFKKTNAKEAKQIELLSEIFVSSESFQKYEDTKAFLEAGLWQDCLKEIMNIPAVDQDNSLVLRVRAECQREAKLLSDSSKSYQEILQVIVGDQEALFGLASVYYLQKNHPDSLRLLAGIGKKLNPRKKNFLEKYYILIANNHLETEEKSSAILELEKGITVVSDSVSIPYKLANVYYSMKDPYYSFARKYYNMVINRYMKLNEKRKEKLKEAYVDSQTKISEIDSYFERKK